MSVRLDTVLNTDSEPIFKGTSEEVVSWFEKEFPKTPLWISIGETGDLITASQYLDLAT